VHGASWAEGRWTVALPGTHISCAEEESRLTTKRQQVVEFQGQFLRWAASQPDILGVGLVGSYARNGAKET